MVIERGTRSEASLFALNVLDELYSEVEVNVDGLYRAMRILPLIAEGDPSLNYFDLLQRTAVKNQNLLVELTDSLLNVSRVEYAIKLLKHDSISALNTLGLCAYMIRFELEHINHPQAASIEESCDHINALTKDMIYVIELLYARLKVA